MILNRDQQNVEAVCGRWSTGRETEEVAGGDEWSLYMAAGAVHFFQVHSWRETADTLCRRGILFLFTAMLLFAPAAFGAVDEWAWLVVQGLAVAIFILWGLRLGLKPETPLKWPALGWFIAAAAFYALIRYFTADIEYLARGEVIQVWLFALIFFMVLNNLNTTKEITALTFLLFLLGTAISLYAVTQLATHSNRVWNMKSVYLGRAGGTYINPNDLAGFLEMLLPLAMAYLLIGATGKFGRLLVGLMIVAMLAGLGVTFSRAGWLAAAAGMVVVLLPLLVRRRYWWRVVLLTLVLMLCGGVFVGKYLGRTEGFQVRVRQLAANPERVMDANTRFEIWLATERMWMDHLWFGVGPAHFDARFPEYRPISIQTRPERAHNDYLNLLADWGVTGGIIVLGGMICFVVMFMRGWRGLWHSGEKMDVEERRRLAIVFGGAGGLAALAVHSLADFNLHIPANALLGVSLLAFVTSQLQSEEPRRVRWVISFVRAGLAVILIVVSLAFAVDGWRQSVANYWLSKARQEDTFSPSQSNYLQKAFAAEPNDFETADGIGECYRMQSFEGGDDYRRLGVEAVGWYTRAIDLNRYSGISYLRIGMSLDWLGQGREAAAYYDLAEPLDPNGYFMEANIGWHFVQTGDFSTAREYFIRSIRLSDASVFAENYLKICETKLLERASGTQTSPFGY